MLNKLRPALSRVLTPVGHALARTPLTPNAITIVGTIGVAAGALALFPGGHLFAGTVVCTGTWRCRPTRRTTLVTRSFGAASARLPPCSLTVR